jgi:NADPH:quinone reductase-like Zn-dependent oxidoreductase
VIATGRNEAELEQVRLLGADVVIPFALDAADADGAKQYEQALKREFGRGVDVVLDYLWGQSAKIVIVAIAKAVEDARPVRFVHVGGASREENIELPGAALRSSAIQMMGSGLKSVPLARLLGSVGGVFEAAVAAGLRIETRTVALADIEKAWESPNKPRVVVSIG